MNYAALLADIQAWLENDGTELEADIGQIIDNAELRIYRECKFLKFRKTSTIAVNASSTTAAQPDDIIFPRYIRHASGAALIPKDETFILEYNANTSSGTIKYYANDVDGDNFVFGPVPSALTNLNIGYFYRPTGISATNTTTWLGDNAPDLLLAACLVGSTRFMKSMPQDIAEYEAEYARIRDGVIQEERVNRMTDFNRAGEG